MWPSIIAAIKISYRWPSQPAVGMEDIVVIKNGRSKGQRRGMT